MLESWTVTTEFSVRVWIKHGRNKVFQVRGPLVKRPTGGNEWGLYKGLEVQSKGTLTCKNKFIGKLNKNLSIRTIFYITFHFPEGLGTFI